MNKSTITRERLQEIAEDGFLKHGESKELARMALAAMDSEPVVPEEMPCGGAADDYHDGYQDGWNACRATMLQAEPVTTANKLGNSPVVPDGYVMVPKVVTPEISNAINEVGHRCTCGNCSQRLWDLLLAAAPQEVKGE